MINLFQAQKLGFNKIRFSIGKSLFLIIPIALMVLLIVFASSEAGSLINVARSNIFSPIESQNEVIEVTKNTSLGFGPLSDNSVTVGFTDMDVEKISNIESVEKVGLIEELPIDEIKTSDVFEGKTINIANIYGLDEEFATVYTNELFKYVEGEPIPIILNTNDFYEVYEDWQDQTSITITVSRDPTESVNSAEASMSQSPIKVKSLPYDRDSLIGKTITVQFGGLSDISTYTYEASMAGFVYTLRTEEEIQAKQAERETAISQYWNYDEISTPIEYEFVIVGISEGEDKTKTFIPQEFADKLLNEYLKKEIASRNTVEIPSSEMNSTFIGLVYDGISLKNDSESVLFASMRKNVDGQISDQFDDLNQTIEDQNAQIAAANKANKQAMQDFQDEVNAEIDSMNSGPPTGGPGGGPGGRHFTMPNLTSIGAIDTLDAGNVNISYPDMGNNYTIPGLVYEKDTTTSELVGEYIGFNETQLVPLDSNSIIVKIEDVSNRESVVESLNSAGFSFQDYSKYKQFQQIESYLKTGVEIVSIVFMVITALFILINMAKFVSEARKEIGIFRAMGATKGDIRIIFILQSLLYSVLALAVGVVMGVLTVWGLSSFIAGYAQEIIAKTIGETIILNTTISGSDFMNLNYMTIVIYCGSLLFVTLIVSLIPSGTAAKTSPVEAIRN